VVQLDLILAAVLQRTAEVWSYDEIVSAVVRSATGIATAFLVYQLVRRVPWPRPSRVRFLAVHLLAAPAVAVVWGSSSWLIESLVMGGAMVVPDERRREELLLIGTYFYVIVAGVSYAVESSARAARAEAIAARTQLAALRAQIHPHFLFNALHTVMQLVPADPVRAAQALELLAELLRTTLGDQRDEVSLGDEWRFVSRYLALERIRFGDRLVVREDIAPHLLDARVPAFALQTLVENAVQHGAAPRVAPTEIVVAAANGASELMLSVRNSGDVGAVRTVSSGAGTGTGLARLRERLGALYGGAARLECRAAKDGGFEAVLVVPRHRGSAE
jgi:LytS/YehU family sensor histidine kinase